MFLLQWKICIHIGQNAINNKELKTQENDDSLKYLFNKEKNALSEYGNGNGIQAKDYEVYQIIFSENQSNQDI